MVYTNSKTAGNITALNTTILENGLYLVLIRDAVHSKTIKLIVEK
jgi:hypothetical protein